MAKQISMTDLPKRKSTKPAKVPAGKKKKKNKEDSVVTEEVITVEDSGNSGALQQQALPFIPDPRTEVNEPMIIESPPVSNSTTQATENLTTRLYFDTPESRRNEERGIPNPSFPTLVQQAAGIPMTNIPQQYGIGAPPPPKITPQCPIHFVEIVEKLSKNKNFSYFECPTNSCCMFAAKGEEEMYMYAVITTLCELIKDAWRKAPLRCKCQKLLTLKRSRSQKNMGRLYLSCRWRECDYFQWGDLPITAQNQDHHFNQNMLTLTKEAETQCDTPKNLREELLGASKQTFEEALVDPEFLKLLSPHVIEALKKQVPFLTVRKWFIEGPYFYDDGNYPDEILMMDDGKNTIGFPPELAGLQWREIPDEKKKEEAVAAVRNIFRPTKKAASLPGFEFLRPMVNPSFGGVKEEPGKFPLAFPNRGGLF